MEVKKGDKICLQGDKGGVNACLIDAVNDPAWGTVSIGLEVHNTGGPVGLGEAPEEGWWEADGGVQHGLIDGVVRHHQCAPGVVSLQDLPPGKRCPIPKLPARVTILPYSAVHENF